MTSAKIKARRVVKRELQKEGEKVAYISRRKIYRPRRRLPKIGHRSDLRSPRRIGVAH